MLRVETTEKLTHFKLRYYGLMMAAKAVLFTPGRLFTKADFHKTTSDFKDSLYWFQTDN